MPVKKKLKRKFKSAASSSSAAASIEQLAKDARSFVDAIPPQVDRAMELYEQALKLDSDNTVVLDAFGALLCDEGDHPRAKELLQRSVRLKPDIGYSKYLCLAQMVVGAEALVHYERSVQILLKRIKRKQLTVDVRKLATVQASIAEIYMTELCDESNAEDKCEEALTRGLVADPTCLELLVAKIALRKVQGHLDESKELGVACLKQIKEASASSDADVVLPSDEVCIALCRALIDLGLVEEARSLLLHLLEQDEEDIQVWYLLACSHLVEEDVEAVQECAQRGLSLCEKAAGEADDWKQPLSDVLAQANQLKVDEPEDPDDEPN